MIPKTLNLIAVLVFVLSWPDRGSCQQPAGGSDESTKTAAINEVIALFEKAAKKPAHEKEVTAKYYRKGSTTELICDLTVTEIPEKPPTAEEIRIVIIEMLGVNFTVGDLRRYSSMGLAFTIRGVIPDGKEIFRGTAKFEEVMVHYRGHNF